MRYLPPKYAQAVANKRKLVHLRIEVLAPYGKKFKATGILIIVFGTTLADCKPVVLACETQFTGCVKELDGRKVCAPPRLQKNTIELNENTIRHLDDYGYLKYEKCEVSDAIVICEEELDAPSPPSSMRSSRRLTIERTTGRLDASIDTTLIAVNGVNTKHKGWLNTYSGYCTVREGKTLF